MAQYSSILVLQRKKTDNRISKDIMRTQILQASLSHIQAYRPKYTRPQVTIVKHPHFYLICHKKFSYAHVLT